LPKKHCEQNIWVAKPTSLNQGRGIEVLKTFRDIVKFSKNQVPGSNWIIQKYIEKPLLYKG
jgi:hypothetical protein